MCYERNIRLTLRGILSTFASPDGQRQYQRDVPFISVPAEMFCQWADDVYHPDFAPFCRAFTAPEREALADFDQVFRAASATLPEPFPGLDEFLATPQAGELALAAARALSRLGPADEVSD